MTQEQQTDSEVVFQLEHGCRYAGGKWQSQPLRIVKEMPLTLYLNKHELVTLLCTPNKLNQLVLGFLHLQGLIKSADDVAFMRVCAEESVADINLLDQSVRAPERRVLTTGCGGGVALNLDPGDLPRLETSLQLTPDQVLHMVRVLRTESRLYPVTGGVHASMLSDGERALAIAEDVARHNTIDKIDGECLLTGAPTAGQVLVTTGRISSEMLVKAARMRTPIVISRTSPTHLATTLAEQLGITLVGYARSNSFSVYTHSQRIVGAE